MSSKISGAATAAPKNGNPLAPRPAAWVREENDDDGVIRLVVVRAAA